MAVGPGDRVGMTAGHDVQCMQLARHFAKGDRHRRIDIAEQKVDLVALDQLARLLHRDAGIGTGRILDQ